MPPDPNEFIESKCEAARNILEDFGPEKAMGYLIGEKFLNFLEVAETFKDYRATIPAFVAEIQSIFEPWQLAEYLDTPRRLGALGHTADQEGHRMLREGLEESERIQEDARNLMMLRVGEGIAAETRRRNVEGATSWTQRFSSRLNRFLTRLLQLPTSNLVRQNSSECCPNSPKSWDKGTRCPSASLWTCVTRSKNVPFHA